MKNILLSLLFVCMTSIASANPATVENKRSAEIEFHETYLSITIDGPITAKYFEGAIDVIRYMTINKDVQKLPIIVYIDTRGGRLDTTERFVGALDAYQGKIITVNEGTAYSAGALIYAFGDIKVASKYSTTLYHGVQISLYMPTLNEQNLRYWLERVVDTNKQLLNMVSRALGYTVDELILKRIFDPMLENNTITHERLDRLGLVDYDLKTFLRILGSEKPFYQLFSDTNVLPMVSG